MKLSKANRPRFSLKIILSVLVVSLVVCITVFSFSNSGRVDLIEKNDAYKFFYSFGKHVNNVVVSTGNFFDDLIKFRTNSNRVLELEKEKEKLTQKIIELNSDESKRESLDVLKKSLNYVSGDQRNEMVSASVIGKNDGDWYLSFIIDAGFDNGIEKNSIVINGNGVVGIVYSVSNKYSKAISIVDSKASVSFKISGKDESRGVITTSTTIGKSELTDTKKILQGYMFDSNSKVKTGDLIVTSGLGFYPENIPIGKVIGVRNDKNKSMKIVKIQPSVDFKKIDNVSIIPPRKID